MPGFLVCLVVTAFVFAPVALLISRGSLEGFLDEGPTPVQYVWSDLFLRMNTYQIGQTLADVPYPHVWNGSLWSLSYGFDIYAWPVQQLAVTVGGPSTNLFVLILVCTAVTFALAWASWLFVERPVIRRVRRATAAAAPPVPPGPATRRSSSAEPEAVGFRG
ncbi:hypothetical protein K8F61_08010 [Microbacterium resistens]|uniref:Uncharacterized protein n=1 Tax=Microbacterium resistens TaxID=156977 RepID=A0ABY3RVJ8_9MICO|nr:hypothetical protein [Microbacterium resistens]UGS28093.1 hypothetical protein K8F61_08010 [Microbacterium resistens]